MARPDDVFENLYRRYYGSVRRLLLTMGLPNDHAEDLAQETFVRVYNHIGEYRGDAEWSYVQTIARRVLLNDVRARAASKRTGIAVPLDDIEPLRSSSNPADELLRSELAREQRARLHAAVSELPPESSSALRLWLTGLKQAEIAQVLSTSEESVRDSLAVARRTIRRRAEGVHVGREGADVLDEIFAADAVEPLLLAPIADPHLIFDASPLAVHVPQMIVSVEDALVEAIKREPQSVFAISPRAFEQLIAGVFKRKGFETELTKATRDGGRDIIAVHEVLGMRSKYIIECKRYAAHRKVTLQLVQRLYGVKVSEGANKAILATTSTFTRDARNFASHHVWDLELKSFEDILAWVREYRA